MEPAEGRAISPSLAYLVGYPATDDGTHHGPHGHPRDFARASAAAPERRMIFLLLGCSVLGLTLLLPTLSDLLSLAAIGFGRPSAPPSAPGPGEGPRLLVLVP